MPVLETDRLRANAAGGNANGDDEEGNDCKNLDSGRDQHDIASETDWLR